MVLFAQGPDSSSKGLYTSLVNCPHRVIYVREAIRKIDTLYMAPTLVVPSVAEEEHLKEFNNVQNYSNLQIAQYFFKKLLLKYQPNFFLSLKQLMWVFLMIVVFSVLWRIQLAERYSN